PANVLDIMVSLRTADTQAMTICVSRRIRLSTKPDISAGCVNLSSHASTKATTPVGNGVVSEQESQTHRRPERKNRVIVLQDFDLAIGRRHHTKLQLSRGRRYRFPNPSTGNQPAGLSSAPSVWNHIVRPEAFAVRFRTRSRSDHA